MQMKFTPSFYCGHLRISFWASPPNIQSIVIVKDVILLITSQYDLRNLLESLSKLLLE